MRTKILFFTSLLLLFLFSGCRKDYTNADNPAEKQETETAGQTDSEDDSIIPGMIRVKLSPSIGNIFTVTMQGAEVTSNVSELNDYLRLIQATGMKRVFPYAGKFEERTRREGLHLWYEITFDENRPVTRAVSDAADIPGIDIVEKVYKPVIPTSPGRRITFPATRADGDPFNDPGLIYQWHYNNIGLYEKSIPGADINLYAAWEIETGKPAVIVSVVDGGIDYTHVDLNESMWVNLAELNGEPDVDDDGNGYIDDIYGYNFVSNRGVITADDHGTHVSGTIAARNNNGIGVCGVAGGDGTPESGARLMSCQMFEGVSSGNSAEAVKYGADNGAVISQNSWGYTKAIPIQGSDKAAIDYFIKYAGCDNDGNQLPDSPMKGGIVIFAAGNDSWDVPAYPAAYEPVISVSAMTPDFKKTWYDNRGEWISIMAPGGDEFYTDGMVVSTVSNNQYAAYQGTSMACPHVSGIAALAVSHLGGPGFTNEELKTRILSALKKENIDLYNPDYVGRLGRGFIDAARLFDTNENKAPAAVAAVEVEPGWRTMDLSWEAVADEDDGTASIYWLYYSDSEILTKSNYLDHSTVRLSGVSYQAGETVNYTLPGLSIDTEYHFAMVAEDRWGLVSAPIFFSERTKINLPPELTVTGADPVRVTGTEIAEVAVLVFDPEGHEWDYKISGEQRGVTYKRAGDRILFSIQAMAPVGQYLFTVKVADIYGYTTSVNIAFEIYINNPPVQVKAFSDPIYVPLTKQDYTIRLTDYFTDPDGHDISYNVSPYYPSIALSQLSGDVLTIRPVSLGAALFGIEALDSQNAKTSVTMKVQVVENELVYLVYPIPVTDVLNILLGDVVQQAEITIRNTSDEQAFNQTVTVSSDESRRVKLNLSKLSAGTYTLYVESGGKMFSKTFIKY